MATYFKVINERILDHLCCKYLSYQDYLTLTIAEPSLQEIDYRYPIEARIKRFLELRLADANLANQLFSATSQRGAMMSGSMILGLVYNTSWTNADLDIFVPVSSSPHIFTPLDRLLRPYRVKDKAAEDFNFKKYSQFYRGSERFVAIRQFEIPVENNFPLSIQLINVSGADTKTPSQGLSYVQAFVASEFDFDFCKVGFDGEHFWFASEARKALATRSCAPNYIIPETLERMKKYLNRGFRFIGVKEYLGLKRREAFFKKKKGRLVDIKPEL